MYWKQHLVTSWQLENPSGIKVWLAKSLNGNHWILDIGDENRETLPGFLSESAAKRMAIGKTIAYLNLMIKKLERIR